MHKSVVGLEQACGMVRFALLQGSIYCEHPYGLPGHHGDASIKGEGKSNIVNTDNRNLLPFHLHLGPTPHLWYLNCDEQLPFFSLHPSEQISVLEYAGACLIACHCQGVHSESLNEGTSFFCT
jgi:hypothetical protein